MADHVPPPADTRINQPPPCSSESARIPPRVLSNSRPSRQLALPSDCPRPYSQASAGPLVSAEYAQKELAGVVI